MKIFLFRPRWDYCGGGIVVIANTVEEAWALARQEEEKEKEIPGRSWKEYDREVRVLTNHDYIADVGTWQVVDSFDVSEKTPRVVLFDWNHA